MIKAIRVDILVDIVQEIFTVTGEKVNSGNLAFLKNFIGIDPVGERFGVAVQNFALT